MALSYFCPHCGAENIPGEMLCHVCQHTLAALDATAHASALLNERYEVLVEVGSGGFGAVYKARDTRENDCFVAVKQINLKGLSPQEIIEATDAFNREAQLLSVLSHPLLPRIFDRFSDPDHWYLIMNFIDGQTLDDYLREQAIKALPARAGLPLAETLAIGLQLCDVLHYLHTCQPAVIFRDLKPGNIMRTARGHLYLIDFGIARRFKPGQTKDTIPFGSPGFAAPEQYGRAQTTPQADIYSLGALLYYLLSDDDPSEHPFQFPPLHLPNVAGLRELEALIQRMVALEITQRPTDIQEVQDALQNIKHISIQAAGQSAIWLPPSGQAPLPANSTQHILFPSSPNSKTSRRGFIAGGIAAGGTLLVGGLAVALLHSLHTPTNVSPAVMTAIAQDAEATAATTNPPIKPTYWSPDLSHAAILNTDQLQVDVYNMQSKQLLMTIKPPDNLSAYNFSSSLVQWSPDNSKVVFACAVASPSVWDVASKAHIFTVPTPLTDFPTMIWSPNGESLAAIYFDENNLTALTLLRASDGKRFFEKAFDSNVAGTSPLPSANNNPVSILAWSPDSTYLLFPDVDFSDVTPTNNWSATTWQINTAQPTNKLAIPIAGDINQTFPNDPSLYMAWSPRGDTIAIYYGQNIWICSLTSIKATYTLELLAYNELNYGPIWSPDATLLAVILDGNLLVLDALTGQTVLWSSSSQAYPGNVVACTWSADSRSLTAVDDMSTLYHCSL